MKERFGSVYLIYNKINSKVYVGITKKTFNKRYSANGTGVERVVNYYYNNKKTGNYINEHLVRSIESYGKEAFEVIEDFAIAYSKKELLDLEKKTVLNFRSNNPLYGYNRTEGGDDYGIKKGAIHPRYNSIIFNCEVCGRESVQNQAKFNRSNHHYCSSECKVKGTTIHYSGENNKNRKRQPVKCDNCGTIFDRAKSLTNKTNYCSRECQKDHYKIRFSGEKNPNYKNGQKIIGSKNGRARKVLCVTTDEIFETLLEGAKKYNINNNYISACCTGKQKSAGKLPDGTPLRWEYIE